MGRTLLDSAQIYYDDFKELVYANADPRSKDMLFMGPRGLDGMILLTLAYIGLTILGPRLMVNYKALNLKWPMFVYNIFMALFAFWMFLEFMTSTWQAGYNYISDNYSGHTAATPQEYRVVGALWWYFVTKPIEFMDTLFMVLKKKNSQITFLHVWHHVFMFPFLFFATLIGPGGLGLVPAILNCLVHTVMYTYYGLSLFPSLQPYLGWKKYLTQMQLIQFFLILSSAANGLRLGCDYPFYVMCAGLSFFVSLVVLFANFYVQAYLKRKHRRDLKAQTNGTVHQNGHANGKTLTNGTLHQKKDL